MIEARGWEHPWPLKYVDHRGVPVEFYFEQYGPQSFRKITFLTTFLKGTKKMSTTDETGLRRSLRKKKEKTKNIQSSSNDNNTDNDNNNNNKPNRNRRRRAVQSKSKSIQNVSSNTSSNDDNNNTTNDESSTNDTTTNKPPRTSKYYNKNKNKKSNLDLLNVQPSWLKSKTEAEWIGLIKQKINKGHYMKCLGVRLVEKSLYWIIKFKIKQGKLYKVYVGLVPSNVKPRTIIDAIKKDVDLIGEKHCNLGSAYSHITYVHIYVLIYIYIHFY